MIIQQVQMYLQQAMDGDADISDELLDAFAQDCRDALKSQLRANKRTFAVRASSVGKPLCQLKNEQADTPAEGHEPFFLMKMLIGHMVEAASVAIMKAAGVRVANEQAEVDISLSSTNIKGHIDCTIDDKVYDIKSASKYAFTHKFKAANAFSKMLEDDPFGYIDQAYLYAKGMDMPFGGWIVICKETGEWTLTEAPAAGNSYGNNAIRKSEYTVKELNKAKDTGVIRREFEPEAEKFGRGKNNITGNRILGITCTYCRFKKECWGDITYAPNPRSEAKFPKWHYYVGEIK
jgi:hypothetical protein